MLGFAKKLFGSSNDRKVKQMTAKVASINAFEPALAALDDAALRAKTDEFKSRIAGGESLDSLLPEAFAVVREAAKRTIGLRHFDVQMVGGQILHQGGIAEMRTGEGKTLVGTSPVYLNALTGKGVHVITVNDYLARRDSEWMGQVYQFLGLSVGVIVNGLSQADRQRAYQADITYGTNNEFGFDYLRDNLVYDTSEMVQRGHNFAIVDEVDSILIDEARTPLIISGPTEDRSEFYRTIDTVVKELIKDTATYDFDEKQRQVIMTEEGQERVEEMLIAGNHLEPDTAGLYDAANVSVVHHVNQALRANILYTKDKDYIVKNGEVVLIDEFTGRMMSGRRLSEGLHQAIEAKEGLQVRRENLTLATITFQNFFRMYKKLGGMTGTALTEAEEFEKIYNLEVVPVPTHRPMVRSDYEDLIYGSEEAKFKAVAAEIKERQQAGQPVLVGTVAIETSERLSKLLDRTGVKHQVLNAKQHEREAEIITQAGRLGTVTIATNMAGRGVDILLGGNPEGLARQSLRSQGIEITAATPEQWQTALATARQQTDADRLKVLELGGLFVLGTERHEARRIDNQLRGRAGRQGDPGESRFFLSLEDDLMKRFGGDRVKGFMSWAKIPPDEPIEAGLVSRAIAQAQTRVEGYNFDIRKRVLEYDDVVNKQREVIYRQRRELLDREDLRDVLMERLETQIGRLVDEYAPNGVAAADWDLEALHRALFTLFPVPVSVIPETMHGLKVDDLESLIIDGANEAYDRKAEELGDLMKRGERLTMLNAIDFHWRRHLTDLDVLREGIGLVSIAQRDPLVEYKREAFTMWTDLQEQISNTSVRNLFRMQVANTQTVRRPMNIQAVRAGAVADTKAAPVRKAAKSDIGRNDPCWCGSGKKYKNCHMREDQKKAAVS